MQCARKELAMRTYYCIRSSKRPVSTNIARDIHFPVQRGSPRYPMLHSTSTPHSPSVVTLVILHPQEMQVDYGNLKGTGATGSVESVKVGYGPSVPISISTNGGAEWATSSTSDNRSNDIVRFEYHPPFLLGALDPPSGPAIGGTLVTISLASMSVSEETNVTSRSGNDSNLLSSSSWVFFFDPIRHIGAKCLFNGTVVSASVVSNSSVQCVAPPTVSSGGVSLVRLSVNGVDVFDDSSAIADDVSSRGNALLFFYLPDETEMTLFPTSGPVEGGTTVAVFGRHIADAVTTLLLANAENDGIPLATSNGSLPLYVSPSSAACAFGDGPAVEASALSFEWDGMIDTDGRETGIGRVLCVSPPATDGLPSTVAVEVSLNGGRDFTQRGAQFYYRPKAHISSVEPAFGPVSGGTSVRIEGGPFRDEGNAMTADQLMRCRFGDQETSAIVHSTSLVGCRAPAMASVPEVQDVEVR